MAKKTSVLVVIIFFGFFYSYHELNEVPKYVHTWAQADRYALAIKFTQNDLNFFKPETFVYNHIYPGGFFIPSNSTVTSVDFPIHDYIPAIIMKISGSNSPVIFRLYILLYSLLGMFFLYKLSFLWTGNFYKSLFITILAATSPLFAYYQGGFLPTIPSLSNAIIGIYFYSLFITGERNRNFNLSIVFLTLAALSRTTFLIPLIAVFGIELIRIIRKESTFKPKIIPVLISVSLILGYWLYNNYLRSEYGSMFLASFLPARDMDDANKILSNTLENWKFHYFTWLHYAVFISVLLLLINMTICGKIGKWNSKKGVLGFFILTVFIGTFLFAALLLKQFEAHDYYFLDSFYLPLYLLLILIISFLPLPDTKKTGIVLSIIIASLGFFLFILANGKVHERRLTGPWDRFSKSAENYKDSDKFLDSSGVPKDAKIMVIDASAPNTALTLMNRNGYALKYLTREKFLKTLKWDFDYIVYENENFMQVIYSVYPEIVQKLKKIADNGKISICQYSEADLDQNINDLLGLGNLIPARRFLITFDSSYTDQWENINITKKQAFSGSKSDLITKDQSFGLSFSTRDLPEITDSERTLMIKGNFFKETALDKCYIVVSYTLKGKKNEFYSVQDLKDFLKKNNEWEGAELYFQLPKVTVKDYQMSIYIWNLGKNELLVDDFEARIY